MDEAVFLKFTSKNIAGELTAESPSTGKRATFKSKCSIGAFSYVGARTIITKTVIGRYCSIAEDVTIGPTEHPTDRLSTHLFVMGSTGPFKGSAEFADIFKGKEAELVPTTSIGNDVWIGAGAFIRRGVKIGDGAIIGARAVVTTDVQPYAIVAGIPAKEKRKRFDEETIERLKRLAWWQYDLSSLKKVDFKDIITALETLEALSAQGTLRLLSPVRHILTSREAV